MAKVASLGTVAFVGTRLGIVTSANLALVRDMLLAARRRRSKPVHDRCCRAAGCAGVRATALDVGVDAVRRAIQADPHAPGHAFVRCMIATREASADRDFQEYLQRQRLASFSRVLARRVT